MKKKVFMSIGFDKFKKTKFETIEDAKKFVRSNQFQNTRLKLKTINSCEEWDNF